MSRRTVTVGLSIEHLERTAERYASDGGDIIDDLYIDSINEVLTYVQQLEQQRGELLTALELALPHVEDSPDHGEYSHGSVPWLIETIKAAIAKAKGDAS